MSWVVCTDATRDFCSHVVELTQTDRINKKKSWYTLKRKFYILGVTKNDSCHIFGGVFPPILKQKSAWALKPFPEGGGGQFCFYKETNDHTEKPLKCSCDCWNLNNTSLQIHVKILNIITEFLHSGQLF